MGKKRRVYLISGLACDERIFANISFNDDWEICCLSWLEPLSVDESLENYVKRLSGKINTPFPIIIGLSFGGMIAVQLSKIIRTKQLIIISSFKTKYELPYYFRLAGKLSLNKILPSSIFKMKNGFVYYLLGADSKEERQLIKDMIDASSISLIKWSVNQIINWSNEHVPHNVFHIHGDNDKLLPYRLVQADACISKGGHLMIYNKADKIIDYIISVLQQND